VHREVLRSQGALVSRYDRKLWEQFGDVASGAPPLLANVVLLEWIGQEMAHCSFQIAEFGH